MHSRPILLHIDTIWIYVSIYNNLNKPYLKYAQCSVVVGFKEILLTLMISLTICYIKGWICALGEGTESDESTNVRVVFIKLAQWGKEDVNFFEWPP